MPTNQQLEAMSPHEIIAWAIETYGNAIAMSSSFQTQSVPLLHIVSQAAPQLPIIFLDTGYHFPETIAFRDQLAEKFNLNIKIMRAAMPRAEFASRYGNELYRHDPDLCCYINKVEPMERAMEGLQAWISGIRRDQSTARANTRIVETTPQALTRIHPMATWSRDDVTRYIKTHQLPQHPLHHHGYRSIGCVPCTRPVREGEDDRAGRWEGQGKTECGLHTMLRQSNQTPQVARHQLINLDDKRS